MALFSGDVIAMVDECNDDFEHSVLAAQGDNNLGARVSIVFKRALVGNNGRRGHSLPGEGRRARARRSSSSSQTPAGGGNTNRKAKSSAGRRQAARRR